MSEDHLPDPTGDEPPLPGEQAAEAAVAPADPAPPPPPARRSWVRRIALFPLTRIVAGMGVCGLAGGSVFALSTPLARLLGTTRDAATVLAALPATAVLLLAYAFVFWLLERRPITELSPRSMLREGAGGFLLGGVLVGLAYTVLAAAGAYRVLGTTDGRGLLGGLVLITFFATFEEVVFRGVLYRVVEGSLGTLLALAISAALFGWVHADNPGAGHLGAVSAGLAGMLLGLCYTLTRGLWLPIGLHIGWNYAQVVSGTPVSGNTQLTEAAWLRGELVGSELFTGGTYGIENSLVCIALIVVLTAAGLALGARHRLLVAPFWSRRKLSVQVAEHGTDPPTPPIAG
ncbi:MAG TPA: type II CAAX endopeptidase family protein [Thermoanaerobaculaceae bacterium]|nr:type II CAAX endopeptidase family protein [Thermoanaerobaculaceae bacterium]HRS16916.1 type II CAAX endopeptidase family protein [Thermoanaerobaculaceae bacterium]